ncbi:MAG: CocE/NonD family hydrolase [Acidobacteria bacterium]|nr:CocE/NonD family hydrolase [Acidobacteriota bacterium]
MNKTLTLFLRLVIFLACFAEALAQVDAPPPETSFTRTDAMVPMRDGVRLHTQVYAPSSAGERLPILFLRTPYGIGDTSPEQLAKALSELWADGYVIVRQDIRGRFKSEGQFVMLRQPRDPKDKQAIDESTDAYDTIEWLLKNTPNNGRVGMAGTSYGAWLTVMGMLDPHPALQAVVQQASPADMWIGDDFHHNGAFRLSYGLEYTYMMESSKEISDVSKIIDRYDAYEWYLNLGPLSNVDAKYFNGKLPTWNDFVNHPDYDAFWKRQGFAPWLNRVTVPTLNVAGWWDQEDFYGPIKIYELLERHDKANKNFLVVGPWNHGGWSGGEGQKLGRIDFGSATAQHYRKNILARFFAYHLKGKPNPDLPEALTFRTGANEWISHDAWPPKRNIAGKQLYFHKKGKLSFEPPPANAQPAFDSYISDPNNPVPYRPRPIRLKSGWGTWQVEDQRFSNHSFDKPEPIAANSVLPYVIGFPANDHVFKKGHRIMVHVQSSWFPVIDRNPQRFVPNIFLAKESDFQQVTQRIFRSGQHASHIAVPVLEAAR